MGLRDCDFSRSATLITPELAVALLDRNTERNRLIRRQHVEKLAHDMRMGAFLNTGGTLSITTDGKVIDGQHRLSACIEAGVPFRAVVISGLDHSAYAGTDRGSKRGLHDTLNDLGYSNVTNMAALLRILYRWDQGFRTAQVLTSNEITDATLLRYLPEVSEECVRAVSTANPLPRAVRPRAMHLFKVLIARAVVADGGVAGAPDGDDTVFLEALHTGVTSSTTLVALREALIRNAQGPARRGDYWQLGVLLRTWNRWREGETALTKAVPFVPGGAKANKLPSFLV